MEFKYYDCFLITKLDNLFVLNLKNFTSDYNFTGLTENE